MSRLSALLGLALMALSATLAAEEISVKVIALFTDKAMLSISGEQKILAVGETHKGVKLVSANGRGAVVSIAGENRKLGLNQSIQGNFKAATRSSSRIYPDALGMYVVNGRINGKATRFLVDTGATYVTMSSRHARKVGIDYQKGIRSSARTATQTVPVWQVKLRSITVGGITLNNIDASVIEGAQPDDVLLGNSFLGRTQINRKGRVMELQKRF